MARLHIDWNQVATSSTVIMIAGVLGLSGHLVLEGAIDEVDALRDRQSNLEATFKALHEDIDLDIPVEEPVSFPKKVWNWISFKEFRK
jgi:hypothetical protein